MSGVYWAFFPHSTQCLWENTPLLQWDIKQTDAYQTTQPCIWSGQNNSSCKQTHSLHCILVLCFPEAPVSFLLSICIRSSSTRLPDFWSGLSETWPKPRTVFHCNHTETWCLFSLQHFFVILQMNQRYTPVAQVCSHQKVIPVPFRAFLGPVTQSTSGGVSKLIRHRSDR